MRSSTLSAAVNCVHVLRQGGIGWCLMATVGMVRDGDDVHCAWRATVKTSLTGTGREAAADGEKYRYDGCLEGER